MKVPFAEWSSIGKNDLKAAFIAEGHSLVCFPLIIHDGLPVLETADRLCAILNKEVPDIVFSVDYFPVISEVCQKEDI